jgi:hypothetical protein
MTRKMVHTMRGKGVTKWMGSRRHMTGMGGYSFLLQKGGPGSASAYDSVEDYVKSTGVHDSVIGSGLGRKLSEIIVKPKKSKNIHFNL